MPTTCCAATAETSETIERADSYTPDIGKPALASVMPESETALANESAKAMLMDIHRMVAEIRRNSVIGGLQPEAVPATRQLPSTPIEDENKPSRENWATVQATRDDLDTCVKQLEGAIDQKFKAMTQYFDTCLGSSSAECMNLATANENDGSLQSSPQQSTAQQSTAQQSNTALQSITQRRALLPPSKTEKFNKTGTDAAADNECSAKESEKTNSSRAAMGGSASWGTTFGYTGEDLHTPIYRVEDRYRQSGVFQRWARSDWFSQISLIMVVANAAYLGFDADYNTATNLYKAKWEFITCEYIFCFWFTYELVVRFFAFEKKIDFLHDGWCKFDSYLVLIMIGETLILAPILFATTEGHSHHIPLEPLRLLRLLRLTRITRLSKYFPELLTLTKSLVAGLRAVLSTFVFIVALTYAFAILLQTLMGTKVEFNARNYPTDFGTVGRTMWTLMLDGVFLMATDSLVSDMVTSGDLVVSLSCIVLFVFILLSAVTLMNMLIGSLCEVVGSVTQGEKDEKDIKEIKDTVLARLMECDDGDGLLTRDEFLQVLHNDEYEDTFRALNVDQRFLTHIAAVLYPHSRSRITIMRVMELMLMCRGELPVTVQHIVWAHESVMIQLHDMFDAIMHHTTTPVFCMPGPRRGTTSV